MDRARAVFAIVILLALTIVGASLFSKNQREADSLRATISSLERQQSKQGNSEIRSVTPVTPASSASAGQVEPSQSAAPTEVPATATPVPPTAARASPSATPVPSPTTIPDTQPEAILEVEQVWRQGGWELRMRKPALDVDGINVGFILTSRKTQQVALQYPNDFVTAIDNRGRALRVLCWSQVPGSNWVTWDPLADCQEGTIRLLISPDETITLETLGVHLYHAYGHQIVVDTTNAQLTEVIVQASGIPGIDKARWRIPIPH